VAALALLAYLKLGPRRNAPRLDPASSLLTSRSLSGA
jgi:hypothetical protein